MYSKRVSKKALFCVTWKVNMIKTYMNLGIIIAWLGQDQQLRVIRNTARASGSHQGMGGSQQRAVQVRPGRGQDAK